MAILRARLAGDRDPAKLAAFNADRLNARPHPLAKRLEGNWRAEWLVTLRPSLELSDVDPQQIAEGAARLEAHLPTFDRQIEVHTTPAPTSKRRPQTARRNEPPVERHPHLSRLSGVDLTRIDGLAGLTAQTRIAEIGLEMSRWQTETPFASWLG